MAWWLGDFQLGRLVGGVEGGVLPELLVLER